MGFWELLKRIAKSFKNDPEAKDDPKPVLKKKDITEEASTEICDKCGGKMVIRMGRFGKFMACSNFPKCKNTKNLSNSEN